MALTKLTQEQIDFIKSNSTHLSDGENDWYFIPYWFKQIDNDKFDIVHFDKLPQNVKCFRFLTFIK
jgi:hypothetical protein